MFLITNYLNGTALTKAPFLSTIATKYINYLVALFNLKISFSLSNTKVDNNEAAINIFNELKTELLDPKK